MTYEEARQEALKLRNRRAILMRMRLSEKDVAEHNKNVEDLLYRIADMTPKYGAALDDVKNNVWSSLISRLKDGRYAVTTGKHSTGDYGYTFKSDY